MERRNSILHEVKAVLVLRPFRVGVCCSLLWRRRVGDEV